MCLEFPFPKLISHNGVPAPSSNWTCIHFALVSAWRCGSGVNSALHEVGCDDKSKTFVNAHEILDFRVGGVRKNRYVA